MDEPPSRPHSRIEARIIWGANLIPSWGRVRRVTFAPRAVMFAHGGQ
jgi:hypothetical protein